MLIGVLLQKHKSTFLKLLKEDKDVTVIGRPFHKLRNKGIHKRIRMSTGNM